MQKELQEIVGVLDTAARPLALATVVRTSGSTYRKAGARLLMLDGRQVGSISGGCLEGDVQLVAEEVLAGGEPRLLTYDLTADDDQVWGLGLGCNGKIDVLVEAIPPDGLLAAALRRAARGESLVLATVIAGDALPLAGRMTVHADGTFEGDLDAFTAGVRDAALRALDRGRGEVLAPGQGVEIALEPLQPPARLVVCGAGHDVVPLVDLASRVGFEVTVVDRREGLLTPARFPGAARFVATEFPRAAEAVRPDARTSVLIMTHNFNHDRDLLTAFLPSEAGYVGLLGPRERAERLLRALRKQGTAPTPAQLARLHTPVGLDIGSEGPEEIALAIVAEVVAARRGRHGGPLRDQAAAAARPAS